MTDETNPQAFLPDDETNPQAYEPVENSPEGPDQRTVPGGEPAETEPPALLPEFDMNELPEGLRPGFQKLGWTSLMPVQARAIPYILANRDVMIQSRTGSGKTGAYLVPIMQRINPELNATQALVLVPTRELAQQVVQEAEVLGAAMNVRTVAVYGGVGYGPQNDAFRQGAHLVVGTPGRILDHLLRRNLTLDKLRMLIFDEADRMLSMGFYPDMKRVQRYLPDRTVNTYMFSATFPPRVLALSNEFMYKPEFLNLSSDHVHVTEVEHVYYVVPPMDKERAMIRIIEAENPASALVFCNTRERVHFVTAILQRYGYNAAEISSDLSQAAREAVMEQIKEGRLRFLVATDVASRGIDINELSHVFLYEVPDEMESYIHRAGRTGRAGAGGIAISLVNQLERVELTRIGKRYAIDLQERSLPTEEEVQAIIAQRTIALLEARLRTRDRLQVERMGRFLPLLKSLSEEEGELAGVAMLLDDFYHENFHTAQSPAPTGERVVRRYEEERRPPRPRSDASGGMRRDRHTTGRSSQPNERAPRPPAQNPPRETSRPEGSGSGMGGGAIGGGAMSGGAVDGEGQPAARRRRRRGGRGRRPEGGPTS